MAGGTESGIETPRAAGAFGLIPRISRVDGGRSAGFGRLWVRCFAMVTGGVFESLLRVADGMEERDQRGDGEQSDDDDENTHWRRGREKTASLDTGR